jgi:hypothetical protein
MTDKQKQLKIAFRKKYKSQLLRQEPYSGDYIYSKEETFFLENLEPFEAELEYVGYETGRSSLHTIWLDRKNDREYVASFNLLDSAVKDNKIKNSKVKGKFQFYKQGTSILLEAVEMYY